MTIADGASQPLDYKMLATRYQRVLEVARTISSTLDLPELLRRIVHAAAEVTETEAVSIMLYDSSIHQLRFEASTAGSSSLERITVPIEGSIAGTVFTTAQPLFIPDVSKDSRFFRKVDSQSSFVTRSILCVPLIYQEKPIGVLQALNKKQQGNEFGLEDIETLESLAAQAAVAIVNARLFQQSDLISEMVHEIRTPLSALTATSYILLRPNLSDEQRAEFVQLIQSETSRLAIMTTDFLAIKKAATSSSPPNVWMRRSALRCAIAAKAFHRKRCRACLKNFIACRIVRAWRKARVLGCPSPNALWKCMAAR
ncbi:MAG: GAF domain-containing protein [Chloroflexi bacterium]|nr:GAF domain-containing protein [Chloroflexota bacterium]